MTLASATAVVISRVHATPPQPDYREGLVTSVHPLSLDPYVSGRDPAVRDVGVLLYRRLLRLDDRAYPVPDMASSYKVSSDGLTYSLGLPASLRWSDGQQITPADVVATAGFLQSKGFPDPALAAEWRDVKVTASGGGVTFTLPAPRAAFPVMLASLPILPAGRMSASDIAALPSRSTTAMPTSGPYEVSVEAPTVLRLEPNPHAAVAPKLRNVEIRLYGRFDDAAAALSSGDVDAVLATDPSERARLLRAPGAEAHDIVTFRFTDLLFNERVPGLDDPAVRHAVAQAIDRSEITGHTLGGMAAVQDQAIPEGIRWAVPPTAPAVPDLAAAAAQLDQGGWTAGPGGVRGRNGVTLSFTLDVADAGPQPAVAQDVARQLKQLGIAVTVKTVPPADFVSQVIVPARFQLAIADWDNSADPDVSGYWRSDAVPPNGFNVSGAPADPFLDQDLDSLATLSDQAQRQAAAARVSSQLAADAPAVFLYAPEVCLVVRGIPGVTLSPVGESERYQQMATWHR